MALLTVNFYSESLMRTVTCNVVLPSDKFAFLGTDQPPAGPYATLYLLNGLLGNYTDWITNSRIQLLATERNLAVVMPSGDNKFYCNSNISGDRYGDFIGKELVAFTRRSFNLSCRRDDTFIGGLSMGGYGAVVNGLRNPETFSRIVALSSAFLKERIENATDDAGVDFFTKTQYAALFGLHDVSEFEGSENDYDALAERCPAEKRPSFFMMCGAKDSLCVKNKAYRDKLVTLGYDVTWIDAPGVHNWAFWDKSIEKAVEWLPLGDKSAGVGSGNVGHQ